MAGRRREQEILSIEDWGAAHASTSGLRISPMLLPLAPPAVLAFLPRRAISPFRNYLFICALPHVFTGDRAVKVIIRFPFEKKS